jgi:hypothetical protein
MSFPFSALSAWKSELGSWKLRAGRPVLTGTRLQVGLERREGPMSEEHWPSRFGDCYSSMGLAPRELRLKLAGLA